MDGKSQNERQQSRVAKVNHQVPHGQNVVPDQRQQQAKKLEELDGKTGVERVHVHDDRWVQANSITFLMLIVLS